MIKLSLFSLALIAQVASAGLEKYSSLVVADKYPFTEPEPNAIHVTYLGVNGFQFETNGHALLVDPYFTRVGLLSAALNQPIQSDPNRVAEGLKHVRPRVDAIVVTHAHFDHLLDAPEIVRRTHGKVIAGPTAIRLVESSGISPNECKIVPEACAKSGRGRFAFLRRNTTGSSVKFRSISAHTHDTRSHHSHLPLRVILSLRERMKVRVQH